MTKRKAPRAAAGAQAVEQRDEIEDDDDIWPPEDEFVVPEEPQQRKRRRRNGKGEHHGPPPSDDVIALSFVEKHRDLRYVEPWKRGLKLSENGCQWQEEESGLSTTSCACIAASSSQRSISTAAAPYVSPGGAPSRRWKR